MGQNENLLRVLEIRSNIFIYQNADGTGYKVNEEYNNYEIESKIIKVLIHNIGVYLLYIMKGKFCLHNTNVINTIALDSDSEQEKIIENSKQIKLGGKEPWNHFGQNVFQMSRSHFHSLKSDEERLAYIAGCHYESLVAYCEKFGQDTTELHKGIEILRKSDWYFPFENPKYINRKKTLKVWIQTLWGYKKDTFRLAIQVPETSHTQYIYISQKEPWIKNYDSRAVLDGTSNLVMSFDIHGWKKGNIFHFQWGEEERYEFHGDSMQLFKNGKQVG